MAGHVISSCRTLWRGSWDQGLADEMRCDAGVSKLFESDVEMCNAALRCDATANVALDNTPNLQVTSANRG